MSESCLGALVTGGIVEYEAAARIYRLPAERAICLAGEGSLNLAPTSRFTSLLAKTLPDVARAFREGGGVPYERFRPEFTHVMDGASRGFFDGQLIGGVLPLAGDLPARLAEGIRAADIGCGSGHSTNLLAQAFPRSTFVGYDIDEEALSRARIEAADYGLPNVTFANVDVKRLPAEPKLDVVYAFDRHPRPGRPRRRPRRGLSGGQQRPETARRGRRHDRQESGKPLLTSGFVVERVRGIEPPLSAWEVVRQVGNTT
jgi:hypothetical protein